MSWFFLKQKAPRVIADYRYFLEVENQGEGYHYARLQMLEELRKVNTKQRRAKAKARKNRRIRLKALKSLDSIMDAPLGADDDADEAGGGGYTFFCLY